MNTIFLNLNDTTALSDSAVVELVKSINACQPCIMEAETNWADVQITFIICVAIVIVAFVVKCAILSWKSKEIEAAKDERGVKKQKEIEESERKQKSELKNKIIDFLGKMTINEQYNEDNDKVIKTQKGMDAKESQYYANVLKSLIDGNDIPNYS